MYSGIIHKCYILIKPIGWFAFSALLMTALYWGIVRFISEYCAPNGLYGLFATAFTMGSPFCQALTHLLVKLSDYYLILWSSATSAFITFVVTSLYIKTDNT